MRTVALTFFALALAACGSSTKDRHRPPGESILDDLVAPAHDGRWQASVIGANGGLLSGYVVVTALAAEGEQVDPKASDLFDQGNRSADPDDALDLYRQAMEIAGDHPAIYNNRGVQLLRMGLRDAARGAFRKAIIFAPGFQPAEDNLDRILRHL
jgi:tetratricopeptide (TPR) repeat protein